jgi:ABC-type bacteriocin/lantibiotic exporter with double-glycine peptidase domain
MPDTEGSRHISPQERLRQILWSEKQDLWVVVAYGVCAGLFTLVVPIAVQALVNTIGFGTMMQPILVLTFLVLSILGFAGLMRTMQSYVMEIIQQRIFARISMDLAFRLPRVRIEAYDLNQGTELVNRFFDVLIVQKSAAIIVLDGIAIGLQSILGMILLAFYHPYLLAFDFVLLLSMLFVVFVLGKKAIQTSIDESKAKYAVAAWLEELAKNPLAFKSYGGPEYALLRSDELTTRYVESRKKHFRILLRQIAGSFALQVLASALLLGLGGWLVIQRQLTLGQLVASELVVTTVVAGFAKFGKYLETYYDLIAAADKLGYLFDLPLERSTGEIPPQPSRPSTVSLKGISFKHPSGIKSLSDVNLEIKAGSRIAILGDNGSGKSTLVSLLFGLRKPEGGLIEIDGMDLREVAIENLRPHVSFVRGIEIFHGTILENVRVNRPSIPLQDVRDTLDSLDLLGNIARLPDGLLTSLSGDQCPLSSGQMQRLMLARAIVGKPKLLIVDESLDNVDSESYKKVIEVLFQKNAPWTLILTTHNPDIPQYCDHVYLLEDGKLRERVLS